MIDPINLGEICKNPNNKIKNCNKDYYEYIEDFFEAFRDLRTMEALWYEEIKNSVLSNNNIVKLIMKKNLFKILLKQTKIITH